MIGFAIAVGTALPVLLTASCQTRSQTQGEAQALEHLRLLTRGDVLPSEDVVARLEASVPGTTAAALARLVRGRIKLNAKDFSGAATLLDWDLINEKTAIGDYGLAMRGSALEQAGKIAEARVVYQELVRSHPTSLRRPEAILRDGELLMRSGAAQGVPLVVEELAATDNPAALLLTGKAYDQIGDSSRALAAYRRLFFYAPVSEEAVQAATAIARLSSTTTPGSAEEALIRADKLFQGARYSDALQAYTSAFGLFPSIATPEAQLRRGIAAYNVRRTADAVAALNLVPSSAGNTQAEALFYLAQTYARARQWPQVRATIDQLRASFKDNVITPRALVAVGQIAQEAKNTADAAFFFRSAVSAYPGWVEVAQAQFDLAWQAHDARNFTESSRLLTEHLAFYADRNTDNRGRAGYWAARDSERAGKLAEAKALYQAMLGRYDANWYGYLAKQRLDVLTRSGRAPNRSFESDSVVGRAVANLQTVTVADESLNPEGDSRITKAHHLMHIGASNWALEELSKAAEQAPNSPKLNLAIAGIYRSREDNVRALNTLRRSFPDYAQMKPEEMSPEEWDVFYPLAYWDIIVQESRARQLDPFQVAGVIRQETIFMTRARSSAKAYGIMQVLVPTAQLTARKHGVSQAITEESLYEPRLNIQIGTAYLKDQVERFGRIEYVAAAYNAGPGRAVRWRETLPPEIDEWVEAIPFRETRLYVQGVVRNRLQYERLYDANGKFRPEVGTRRGAAKAGENSDVRKRRVIGNENEE